MKDIEQQSDSYNRLINPIDVVPLTYLSDHPKTVHETDLIGDAHHPGRRRTNPQKFGNTYVIDAAHYAGEMTQPGD